MPAPEGRRRGLLRGAQLTDTGPSGSGERQGETAPVAPLVVGLSGDRLLSEERRFLETVRPFGVIVFSRNVSDGDRLAALVREAKEAAGCRLALVDQEGGRVARLRPPLARRHPAAARIGELYRCATDDGVRAAWLTGALIARECARYGFNVPCVPVADVAREGMTDAIGDRAYGGDPQSVAALAAAAAEGVLAAGGLPVMKHAPGHGRAQHDTHFDLARVTADRDVLAADAAPFKALGAQVPFAMTSHVIYDALDPERPATTSPAVIAFVRDLIGEAFLFTDDISMKALSGSVAASAAAALDAGCDAVLHCNGDMGEMEAVADALSPMSAAASARLRAVHEAHKLAKERAAAWSIAEETLAAERDALLARVAA